MSISSDVIKAKEAATTLAALNTDVKNNALRAMADALDKNRDAILSSTRWMSLMQRRWNPMANFPMPW